MYPLGHHRQMRATLWNALVGHTWHMRDQFAISDSDRVRHVYLVHWVPGCEICPFTYPSSIYKDQFIRRQTRSQNGQPEMDRALGMLIFWSSCHFLRSHEGSCSHRLSWKLRKPRRTSRGPQRCCVPPRKPSPWLSRGYWRMTSGSSTRPGRRC